MTHRKNGRHNRPRLHTHARDGISPSFRPVGAMSRTRARNDRGDRSRPPLLSPHRGVRVHAGGDGIVTDTIDHHHRRRRRRRRRFFAGYRPASPCNSRSSARARRRRFPFAFFALYSRVVYADPSTPHGSRGSANGRTNVIFRTRPRISGGGRPRHRPL